MDKELPFWRRGTKSKNILILILGLKPFYNNDGGFQYTYKMKSLYDEIRFSINTQFQNEKTFSSTLKKLYALEPISVELFEEIYLSILNSPVQKSFVSSTILLPLNIKLSNPKTYNLKLLSMDVSFKPISDISVDDLKLSPFSKEKKVYHYFSNYISDKSNIIIEIKSKDFSLQKNYINFNSVYNFIRGLLEFTFGYLGSRLFSYNEEPRAKFASAIWSIIITDSKIEFNELENEFSESKLSEIVSNDDFEKFIRNLSKFINLPSDNSTISMLVTSLKLYASAMQAKYSHWAFLGFWQVAETITLSEKFRGNTEKILRRLNYFSNLRFPEKISNENLLAKIASVRNEIVHKGYDEIDEDMITHLKILVDISIRWVIRNEHKYPTISHLDSFYNLQGLSSTELNNLEETLHHIKNEKT